MWLTEDGDGARALGCAAARLRQLGLKSVPSAPTAVRHKRSQSGRVFGAPLSAVPRRPLECCGGRIQVPVVVRDACELLRAQSRTEGIFRKAGSQNRQKEIKRILEAGGKLDEATRAVDAAGLLKLYLRSLPDPIINEHVQESLIRCRALPEDRRRQALRLSLLFVPVSHLHLLHYIMEFLKCISADSDGNKMDSKNLAIVMAPTIMPPPLACPPQRLDRHVELVKFLIENANIIGIVPKDVVDMKIDNIEKEKKKKKRRSGSLTRMFTGLRKMVSSGTAKTTSVENLSTPIIDKGAKKRMEPIVQAFSAKKRKEILDVIPLRTLSSTPRRPDVKENKKLRLSIGQKSSENILDESVVLRKHRRTSYDYMDGKMSDYNSQFENPKNNIIESGDREYVRIPKSEYEAIKNRVSAIENQISKEFNTISAIDQVTIDEPVKQVQTVYEKTLEEAAGLTSPGSEQLARRLSRELKIRQPSEHKIIRSPSARKIGTIKRRSRENVTRLTRTQTWSSSSPIVMQNLTILNKPSQHCNSASLKRGRPNTVNTGLTLPIFPLANVDNKFSSEITTKSPIKDVSIEPSNNSNDYSYSIRNCTRRPSSFHGVGDVNKYLRETNEKSHKYFSKSNETPWQDAKSFLSSAENLENTLTGRASVAQLRNQMAGMVMAKARLFDALTDSDSSLEKPVNKKSTKTNNGFARKSRKPVSPVKQSSIFNPPNDVISSNVENKNPKRQTYKSPGYISKRHRPRLVKSPILSRKSKDHLNLSSQLKDVIYEVCTPLSEKIIVPFKNSNPTLNRITEVGKINGSFKSPRATPQLKKSLNIKPVSSFKATHQLADVKRVNTPMRVNHVTPRRQSPRLISMKARQLI